VPSPAHKALDNALRLDLGTTDEPAKLYSLRADEWIYFDQHYADAGLDVPSIQTLDKEGFTPSAFTMAKTTT
jgi:hypothetical protein